MIEAKNVVKTFDGFRALDGLTMTVPQGSIYGLVGPNGSRQVHPAAPRHRRVPPGLRLGPAGRQPHL